MLIPNVYGKSIRIVEFLPREEERDYLILAFEILPDQITPVVLGTMPTERWCIFQNSVGEDYAATSTGRYVLPNGTIFTNVINVRRHFGTMLNQEVEAPIRKAPGAISMYSRRLTCNE